MKITKQIAREVALKLTKKLSDKNDSEKHKTIQKIEAYLLGELPKDILKIFNSENKNYLKLSNVVRLHGNGFHWEYIYINRELPIIKNAIELPADLAKVIRKEIDDQKVQKRKIEALTDEIELTILNLRTYKNVEQNFKEAFDLLPAPKTNLPIKIDLAGIRKQLK